jgi:hypothetical protein
MRLVSRSRQSLAVVAACVAVTFCGGSSPTSPSSSQSGSSSGAATGSTGGTGGTGGAGASTSCRTAIATYRIVTTGPSFTSTVNGSCTFNPTSVESTCTNAYTDSTGGNFTSVSITKNSSRGDVVDEVSVIPPLTLSSSTTGTILAAPYRRRRARAPAHSAADGC